MSEDPEPLEQAAIRAWEEAPETMAGPWTLWNVVPPANKEAWRAIARAAREVREPKELVCSEGMIDEADARLSMIFAETAILLTYPDAARKALAKERIYGVLFPAAPNTGPGK